MSIRRILKRFAVLMFGIFLLAHIYVLLLGFLPAPRTWNMTGRVIAGETLQRKNVKIEDVSPFLITAIIAAEDARFCSHIGIDREAIEKAIEDNKNGGRRRGGSTITQQTAKNLFFWNGGGMARKAGEAYAALLIDALWSKTRIMEHYLNIAEWGDGIFGAEAAAQARFGKPASALTSYEAALLASVLPSPNKWRLDPPTDFVKGRARTVNARSKVTAREGYANCVLSKHPAYSATDFRAVPPKADPKTEKEEETAPDSQNEMTAENAQISEELDTLAEGQIVSQGQPEETLNKVSPEDVSVTQGLNAQGPLTNVLPEATRPAAKEPALEDLLSEMENAVEDVREGTPLVLDDAADDVETAQQSKPLAPRDIRPPAVEPAAPNPHGDSAAETLPKPDTGE